MEMDKITIPQLVSRRILILDGAMGTMIQQYNLKDPAAQVSRETASLQAMPISTLQRTVAYSVVTLTYNMLRT